MKQVLMFVIYWDPSDFPRRYVVRRWLVNLSGPVADDAPTAVVKTLSEARRSLPEGMVNLGRIAAGQRQIVEAWL